MNTDKTKPSMICNSCGVVILDKGFASFPCPGCSELIICRCKNCRDQSVAYACPGCGFRGP